MKAGVPVLITGASPQSIGEATACAVANGSPGLLILASRTASSMDAVTKLIHDQYPRVAVRTVVLDLANQASVREAAARVSGLTTSLDVLINNAGVSLSTKQISPDGIELTLATNHVGPFLLTNLLMPLLLESARTSKPGVTRIVNVSSSANLVSPFRFSDYNFVEGQTIPKNELPRKNLPDYLYEEHDGFPGMVAYGASKTANLLFTVALNQRLRASGIRSFGVNPGGRSSRIIPCHPALIGELIA